NSTNLAFGDVDSRRYWRKSGSRYAVGIGTRCGCRADRSRRQHSGLENSACRKQCRTGEPSHKCRCPTWSQSGERRRGASDTPLDYQMKYHTSVTGKLKLNAIGKTKGEKR